MAWAEGHPRVWAPNLPPTEERNVSRRGTVFSFIPSGVMSPGHTEPHRCLDGPAIYIVWTHWGIYSLVLMAYICRNRPQREGGRDRSGTGPTSAASSRFSTLFWLYRIIISPSAVDRYTNAMLGGITVHMTPFRDFFLHIYNNVVSILIITHFQVLYFRTLHGE
jgi:hypothetical protein